MANHICLKVAGFNAPIGGCFWAPNDTIQSGDSPSLFDLESSGDYPYIKVDDLNNCSKYQVSARQFVRTQVKQPIPTGAILFPKRGAAILTNKVRIAHKPLYLDSNMMAIKAKDKIVTDEYLYYLITQQKLYKIADTSTIPQINNKHIIPYAISLPPIEEQIKISKILSFWDSAIEKTEQLINAKQKLKKGLMQQLLTGRKRFKEFKNLSWEELKASELFESYTKKGNDGEELLSVTQDRGVIPRRMLDSKVVMPEGSTNGYKLVIPGDFVISLRSFQGGLEFSEYKGLVSPAYT